MSSLSKGTESGLHEEAKQHTQRGVQTMSDLPMSEDELIDLTNYIVNRMLENGGGCEHVLYFTSEFIRAHNLDKDRIISWLVAQGGCCDCAALRKIETCLPPRDDEDEVDYPAVYIGGHTG